MTLKTTAAALALAASAGLALAQPTPADTTPPSPAGPLAGPQVDDAAPPNAPVTFGKRERGQQNRQMLGMGNGTPHPIFLRALRSLADTDNPALAPTNEQREQIQTALSDFDQARRAYRTEHRDDIRALIEQMRPDLRDNLEFNDMGEPMRNRQRVRVRIPEGELTPAQAEARDALIAIRDNAPSPTVVQEQIWAILDADQRAAVEANLAELTDQAQQRRMNPGNNRRQNAERPGRAQRGERAQPGQRNRMNNRATDAPNASPTAERLAKLAQRIDQLPPQQRERALQFLERAIERLETNAQQNRQRQAPPNMNDVNVPDA